MPQSSQAKNTQECVFPFQRFTANSKRTPRRPNAGSSSRKTKSQTNECCCSSTSKQPTFSREKPNITRLLTQTRKLWRLPDNCIAMTTTLCLSCRWVWRRPMKKLETTMKQLQFLTSAFKTWMAVMAQVCTAEECQSEVDSRGLSLSSPKELAWSSMDRGECQVQRAQKAHRLSMTRLGQCKEWQFNCVKSKSMAERRKL